MQEIISVYIAFVIIIVGFLSAVYTAYKAIKSLETFDPYEIPPSKWWIVAAILYWAFILTLIAAPDIIGEV